MKRKKSSGCLNYNIPPETLKEMGKYSLLKEFNLLKSEEKK